VGPVTRFDVTGYAARIAAEVPRFDPLRFVDKKDVKKMDVFIQYAIAASQFAVEDSRLAITQENAPDVGVFIGSGIGGFATIEREHSALLDGGPRRISPFFIPASIINLASGQVSIRLGARTWRRAPPAPPRPTPWGSPTRSSNAEMRRRWSPAGPKPPSPR
jgi:3-oxoacyl-[acyl-carrier-protein] synthase II